MPSVIENGLRSESASRRFMTSSVSWGDSHGGEPLPKVITRKGYAKVKRETNPSARDPGLASGSQTCGTGDNGRDNVYVGAL